MKNKNHNIEESQEVSRNTWIKKTKGRNYQQNLDITVESNNKIYGKYTRINERKKNNEIKYEDENYEKEKNNNYNEKKYNINNYENNIFNTYENVNNYYNINLNSKMYENHNNMMNGNRKNNNSIRNSNDYSDKNGENNEDFDNGNVYYYQNKFLRNGKNPEIILEGKEQLKKSIREKEENEKRKKHHKMY